MKFNEIFALILQLIASAMLVRSCFFVFRVNKEMKKTMYYILLFVLIIGTGLTLYNLTDLSYVERRFPFNTIFSTGSAYAFYLLSKSKKEDLFSIQNVMIREYSAIEQKALSVIDDSHSDNDFEVVTDDVLSNFKMHKQYTYPKVQLIKLTPPNSPNLKHRFKASMLSGGLFKKQIHPDLWELLYIDKGSILDGFTGKVYKAGESISIPPGTPHFIKALERTDISAYLYLSEKHKDYKPQML